MPTRLTRPPHERGRPRTPLRAALAFAAAVLLAACSEGGGQDPATVVVVTPETPQRVEGETQQFSATVNGEPGAGLVTWTSSNEFVATIDPETGLATAVAPGTTRIRATYGHGADSATLTVIANTAPTVAVAATVDVPRSAAIALVAAGSDAEGQPVTIRWTQFAGPDVTGGAGFLTGTNPTFTSPGVVSVLGFSVVASDPALSSAPDTIFVYVLEDHTKALWVRAGAAGTADGSRAAPYGDVAAAIAAASATGADVYLSEGTYPAITLASGVSVYGGFTSDWTARHPATVLEHRSVVRGTGTAMLGASVTDLTIDGLRLEAATPTSGSTYGMRLLDAARVTVSRNVIFAEKGADGAAGATGSDGVNGIAGLDAVSRIGGQGRGPSNEGYGGQGGDGGTGSLPAQAGDRGLGPLGGSGGFPATSNAGGGAGGNGGIGANGASGAGAPSGGSFSAGIYVPNTAGAGASGAAGGGGGGGGGGRNVYVFPVGDYNGGGGGGGGGGGNGGGGGGPGASGGASIGVLLLNPTDVALTGNTIASSIGGRGGNGGLGGQGGAGAPGGRGYDPSTADDGRHGGQGGTGGRGGNGGRGGGGSGGPSHSIVVVGGTWTNTSNTLTAGGGGVGGLPNGGAGASSTIED